MSYDTLWGHKSLEKYWLSLSYEPDNPSTFFFMAITHKSNFRNLDSVLYYTSLANNLSPTWVYPLLVCCDAYLDRNQFESAKHLIDQALQIDSINPLIIYHLALWFKCQNRNQEALREFQRIDASQVGSIMVSQSIGVVYRDLRLFPEAELWFKRVLELDSLEAGALACLGYIYAQSNRFTESEQFLYKALNLNPNLYYARVTLADLYILQQRFPEAESQCLTAVQYNSKWSSAYYSLGVIHLQTGREDEAYAYFNQARQANNMAPLPYFGLACYYVRKGEIPLAIGKLADSLEKGFNNWDILQSDSQLTLLRALPEWKALMKKHFPDQVKD